MKVNTNGASLEEFGSGAGRNEHQIEGQQGQNGVSVTSSGTNAVPEGVQDAPKNDTPKDSGPKVDTKTGAYNKATYPLVVRSDSGGAGTTIVRQDR